MPEKLRIVIFDDDAVNLESTAYLVARFGQEVLSFTSPTICPLYADDAAICTCEEPCADILITDNIMPKMTGLQFINRQSLRGCKGVAKNKAVFSGLWTEEELRLAESLGCKTFNKPLEIKGFLNWIETRIVALQAERGLSDR